MPLSRNRSPAALRFIVVATGLFAAAASLRPASAQSFDCREARYRDELLICEQPALARLDQQLATLYRQKIGNIAKEKQDAFHQHETHFLNARRQCRDDSHCIEQSYRNRIKELEDLVSADEQERLDSATASANRHSESPVRPRDRPSTRSERPVEPIGSSSATANPTGAAEPQLTEPEKPMRPAERHAKPSRTSAAATEAAPQPPATPSGATAEPTASDRQAAKSDAPAKPAIQWVDPPPAR